MLQDDFADFRETHAMRSRPSHLAFLASIVLITASTDAVGEETATVDPGEPSLHHAARTALRDLERFEVRTTSLVRDQTGRRTGPQSHGRIIFEREQDSGVRMVVERWGVDEVVRVVSDGRSLSIGLPGRRLFERVEYLPGEDDLSSSEWLFARLNSPGMEARLGPATMHLIDLMFAEPAMIPPVVGTERRVDIGPYPARMLTADAATDDGRPIHFAFAADGPPIPLAVVTPLPSGETAEFEYHEWSLGSFHDEDPGRFDPSPPTDWTRVMTLPRPDRLDPDVPWHPTESLAGRFAVDTPVRLRSDDPHDLFDVEGPVAIVFAEHHDRESPRRLADAVSDLAVEFRVVRVGEVRSSDEIWIHPDLLATIWHIEDLPALVMVDPSRRVIAAREPWFGPGEYESRPDAAEIATVTEP